MYSEYDVYWIWLFIGNYHDFRISRDIVQTIFVELADDFNNFSKYLQQQKKIGVRFKIK